MLGGLYCAFCLLFIFGLSSIVEAHGSSINDVKLTEQSSIEGGTYWFGSQLASKEGKLIPGNNMEGASPRKKVKVKSFLMDQDTVSNRQFSQFIQDTAYATEAEKYGWSFVLEPLLLTHKPVLDEEFISDREIEVDNPKSKKSKILKKNMLGKPNQIMQEIIDQTDDVEFGMGRVKNSPHWMAVRGANWYFPLGQVVSFPQSEGTETVSARSYSKEETDAMNTQISIEALDLWDYPVVHVSYRDAKEYCKWAGLVEETLEEDQEVNISVDGDSRSCSKSGNCSTKKYLRRLPSELEWEYGARSGLLNQSYPWGEDVSKITKMNIWELDRQKPSDVRAGGLPGEVGVSQSSLENMKQFPSVMSNAVYDGYFGLAPTYSYQPNAYGLYNMLGNVWEWVSGGSKKERPLRGGSFIDSADGSFNHIVLVSTRQLNSPDSSASNVGFRCARSIA